jgi:hypothetical protein
MLTADRKVLPDPGKGATVCHAPLTNCTVPQDRMLESSWMKESGGVGETWSVLMRTRALVKLTAARSPEKLGLEDGTQPDYVS